MHSARAVPAMLAMVAAVGFGVLGWFDYSDRHTMESYFREAYYQRPSEPDYLNPPPDRSAYAKAKERQTSRKGIQIFLTAPLMAAAFFIIASKRYDLKGKRWAYGMVGMIIGYWLRG
ncbi:MAG: hypothetical protein ABSB35_30430 [Bryobacteraceae bacterium]